MCTTPCVSYGAGECENKATTNAHFILSIYAVLMFCFKCGLQVVNG